MKIDAHSPEGIDVIKRLGPYCFALSDDGHHYEDHKAELDTLLPICTGIIAVDDVYVPDVSRAIADALAKYPDHPWEAIFQEPLREAYLQRRRG